MIIIEFPGSFDQVTIGIGLELKRNTDILYDPSIFTKTSGESFRNCLGTF